MKVKFEADVDDRTIQEIKFWGLSLDDVIKDAMEHSIMGSLRRKTDNLCRKCKKPVASSIPQEKRGQYKEFCKCG